MTPEQVHSAPTLAYVTGADTPTGLTTGRALRNLPLRLRGVTTHPGAPGCASNVWDRLITAAPDADAQIDLLLELAAEHPAGTIALLFFAQDDVAQAASRRRDELAIAFRFLLPEPGATELMLDKTLFHEWAGKRGYSVPEAKVVANTAELHEAVNAAMLPAIVKPLVRMPRWDAAMNNQKVLWLRNDEEARRIIEGRDLFALSDRFLVQSWVAGGDADIYFCLFAMDEQGQELDGVAGRKWMQWPPLTGSTAVCEAIDDPALLEQSREILRHAGLRGLGSIEFKRDPRDGRYYITEPTVARNDHQSAMAMLAGHNPTEALARHLLGMARYTPRAKSLPSALWIDELSTYRHCRSERVWGTLAGLIGRSMFRGIMRPLLLDFRDPRPFFAAVANIGARRGGRSRTATGLQGTASSQPSGDDRNGNGEAAPASVVTRRIDENEFLAMAAQWRDLLNRSDADPLFMSWDWLSAWWQTWCEPLSLELFVIAVYRGERLIGLAPLFRRARQLRFGHAVRELHFLGNAWRVAPTVRTEYVDLIVDQGEQAAVTAGLREHLSAADWDLLVVSDRVSLSDQSPFTLLAKGLRLRRVLRQEEAGVRLNTTGCFHVWRASLGPNTRLKAFNRRNYLERCGQPAAFVDEPDSEYALELLNRFHRQRWGKPCFAGASLAFHRRFLERLGEDPRPLFTRVEIAGKTRSLLYDLHAHGNVYNMQAGFEERVNPKVSMGTLHLGFAIERAFADPQSHRYDLLAGSGKHTFYKSHFNGDIVLFRTAQHLRSGWLKHAWAIHDRIPRPLSRGLVHWLDEPNYSRER